MELSVFYLVGAPEAAEPGVVARGERVERVDTLGEGGAEADGGVIVVLGTGAVEEEGTVHLKIGYQETLHGRRQILEI